MVKLFAAIVAAISLFATVASARAETLSMVVLGDSLSAGYGLAPGESFPDRLQVVLRARGHDIAIINAGVSGDTASAALSRLAWAVPEDTDLVIVELGANDALRGVPPRETKKALDAIITSLTKNGAKIILAGMFAPPNLGKAYGEAFNAIYPNLAAKHGVLLFPFFLEKVVANPALNLADGMHPNAQGVEVITNAISELVEQAITDLDKEN